MIRCIAIDDEPLALEIIQRFCGKIPFLDLLCVFTDTEQASKYLRKFPVDLIFLDIQMPEMNGMDFSRKFAADKMVIFTTAYSEYAVEGFNVNALDYLLKPIEFSRFEAAAQKAKDYYEYLRSSTASRHPDLYVRSEYSLVRISPREILYIETLDDYLRIHIMDKRPVLTKMNLKQISELLDPKDFIRIHRSYLIPLSGIESVRGKTVTVNGTDLPLGATYEEDFFARLKL